MRNFAAGEKVIWAIPTAHKNREGYQSVKDGLDGIWLGPMIGRGRAELFVEVASVGPKRIQIRVKRLGIDVLRWVSPRNLYHADGR